MSWCRHSAITSLYNRIPPTLPFQHSFSTTAPLNKKFKPQDLYLLPGQPKARKSKVPKKVLAWRAQREGLSQAREAETDPIAIFAEEVEIGKERRTEDENAPFGLKPGASRAVTRRPRRDDDREFGERPFGLRGRTRSFPGPAETQMAQRIRQVRESMVDLDAETSTPPIAPVPEVHSETVIPSWKIPTSSEYERYDRKARGKTNKRTDDGQRREPRAGWSDQGDRTANRRVDSRYNQPRDMSNPSQTRPPWTARDRSIAGNGYEDRGTFRGYTDTASSNTPIPPVERTPGRWDPTKKLSIPTMQGLRALHQSDPKTFSHAVLSEKFGVSREAVARIIRSRFRDEQG